METIRAKMQLSQSIAVVLMLAWKNPKLIAARLN